MLDQNLYESSRPYREHAWKAQHHVGGLGWEPEADVPQGDDENWWYLQGKAEAYASIMSEIESSR